MKITLLICYLFLGVVHANQSDLQNNTIKPVQVKGGLSTNYTFRLNALEEKNRQLEKKHKEVKDVSARLISELESIRDSKKNTESSILSSTEQIAELFQKYNELKSTDNSEETGMAFEVWAGILLASVAVILTMLGVLIAILAFWGYKEMMKLATAAAVKKTGEEVNNAIESGSFDELIDNAVSRVVYRGVMSESDFPESESEAEVDESK